MSEEYTDKVKMAIEVVDLLIAKGIMKNPEERAGKIAAYISDSTAALRDLMKLTRGIDVDKKPEEPDTGGWIGTYEFKQPVDNKMIYGYGVPFRVLMAGPAAVTASLSHKETGSKVEMNGDSKAIKWLFTEGPFSFLAEAGNE